MKITIVHPTCWSTLFLLCFIVGCDCSLTGKWEYKETGRITSPDAKVDATLVEGSGGATTPKLLEVYLLPAGAKLRLNERADLVFAADHVKGLKIFWKQPKLLRIQYDEARILHFKNIWDAPQDFRYVVEVRLDPTAADFSLPSGIRQW